MKYFYLIVFLFSGFIAISQTTEVTYQVRINKNNAILSIDSEYTLIISNQKSIFKPLSTNPIDLFVYADSDTQILRDNNNSIQISLDDNTETTAFLDSYYKDFVKDSLVYNTLFLTGKIINIVDKLSNFEWQLESEQDSLILGKKCKRAITRFRGRDYEAYYTTEIAENDGPWKFYGLPGLIMQVRSLDNYLVINPIKLETKNSTTNINSPFNEKEKLFTWDNYLNLYSKLVKNMRKRLKALALEDVESAGTTTLDFTDFIEDLGLGVVKIDD